MRKSKGQAPICMSACRFDGHGSYVLNQARKSARSHLSVQEAELSVIGAAIRLWPWRLGATASKLFPKSRLPLGSPNDQNSDGISRRRFPAVEADARSALAALWIVRHVQPRAVIGPQRYKNCINEVLDVSLQYPDAAGEQPRVLIRCDSLCSPKNCLTGIAASFRMGVVNDADLMMPPACDWSTGGSPIPRNSKALDTCLGHLSPRVFFDRLLSIR